MVFIQCLLAYYVGIGTLIGIAMFLENRKHKKLNYKEKTKRKENKK